MNTALQTAGESAPCRLTLTDGSVLADQIRSLTYTAGCSASTAGLTLGSTAAASCTVKLSGTLPLLEGEKVTLEVQTAPGHWTPLGSFRFETPETGEEVTTVTAVDAMLSVLESGYYPASPAPSTALALLQDICAQKGLTLAGTDGLTDVTVSGVLTGYTCREMTGYLAALLGRNAVIAPDGTLELIWYADSGVSIDPDRYYSGGFTHKDYDWALSGLTCATAAGEENTLTAGSSGLVISLSNPFMTQSQLNSLWNTLSGFAYRPGEVTLLGDLRIRPGDLVTVSDRSGGSYTLAVMAVEHTYDGGWKTKLSAYGSASGDTSANYQGPTTTAMERYTAEMASFRKLYTQQLEASAADIAHLQADNANISNLLAGSIGTGNLQAIHITGSNAVIDDAVITDAMIAGLSAGKLTAGTIYTSLIRIASDAEENLLLDGATLQFKDTAGTVRVQIGKDAAGDYNLSLWDAAGQLLWDASGVYAAGLHDGIIRDIAVADDANIAGSKLNIQSVAQKLNADGSLQVDAGQVTIDGTKLDAAYKSVTESTAHAQSTADTAQTTAKAAQTAADSAQSTADAAKTAAATAQSTADAAQQDATDALDQAGAVEARTSTLETSLSVVQGQITGKVWQSDITEVTDPLGERLTTAEEQYSQIDQRADSIALSVGNLQTTVNTQGESLTDISAQLELKVDKSDNDQVVSMLNASADEISITGNRLAIQSDHFTLAADGTLTATNGNFTGTVDASSGQIGGWSIDNGALYAETDYGSVRLYPSVEKGVIVNPVYPQFNTYLIRVVGYPAASLSGSGQQTFFSVDQGGCVTAYDLTVPTSAALNSLTVEENASVSGSLSTYGYTVPRILHGSTAVTTAGGSSAEFSVTFSKAFPGTPHVTLTVQHNSTVQFYCKLKTVSATGFTGHLYNPGSNSMTPTVHWTALYG